MEILTAKALDRLFVDFFYLGKAVSVVDEGGIIMTENEMELIKMIRETDNPGQALMTAGVIIIGYLKQLESSEVQESAVLQELA